PSSEGTMTQFGPQATAPANSGVTNGREIAAYVVTQLVKFAFIYSITYSGVMTPIYMSAARSGVPFAAPLIGVVFSVFWGAVAFPLFMMLRAGLGGVPAVLAASGPNTITTRGSEIGAYAVAFLATLAVLQIVNMTVLPAVYR